MATPNKVKRKKMKQISEGIVHIRASFNNTLITITDLAGNKITQSSSGSLGFKGARKSTPYAAQMAGEAAAKFAKDECGLRRAIVKISGPGPGRESAIRAIRTLGVDIMRLVDVTPLPHNGCRPRKKRRV